MLAVCVSAACGTDTPSSVYEWRGQYRVDSSTCAFVKPGAQVLRLHEIEPGQIALYTPFLPDGWTPIDEVRLEADGDGRLTGSVVTLSCDLCSSCTGVIGYTRDDIQWTSPRAIRLDHASATQAASEATCNADNARALAAAAETCTVQATYVAADRI